MGAMPKRWFERLRRRKHGIPRLLVAPFGTLVAIWVAFFNGPILAMMAVAGAVLLTSLPYIASDLRTDREFKERMAARPRPGSDPGSPS